MIDYNQYTQKTMVSQDKAFQDAMKTKAIRDFERKHFAYLWSEVKGDKMRHCFCPKSQFGKVRNQYFFSQWA